jgi:hypothetical protein
MRASPLAIRILMIILDASVGIHVRLDIVPARRTRIQNGGAEGRRFPRVPLDLT